MKTANKFLFLVLVLVFAFTLQNCNDCGDGEKIYTENIGGENTELYINNALPYTPSQIYRYLRNGIDTVRYIAGVKDIYYRKVALFDESDCERYENLQTVYQNLLDSTNHHYIKFNHYVMSRNFGNAKHMKIDFNNNEIIDKSDIDWIFYQRPINKIKILNVNYDSVSIIIHPLGELIHKPTIGLLKFTINADKYELIP